MRGGGWLAKAGASVSIARYPEAQMNKVDLQDIANVNQLKSLVDA